MKDLTHSCQDFVIFFLHLNMQNLSNCQMKKKSKLFIILNTSIVFELFFTFFTLFTKIINIYFIGFAIKILHFYNSL